MKMITAAAIGAGLIALTGAAQVHGAPVAKAPAKASPAPRGS
jgi:hypothetical protein